MVKDIEPTSGRGFLEYAPAPESASILHLKDSYGLFIDGEFVDGTRQAVLDDLPGDREEDRRDRDGVARGCRPRGRRRAPRPRQDLVEAQRLRSRQVPVPHRAARAGARSRARRRREPRQRQADQGEPRRRRAARRRLVLLLRGLGRQARLRRPRRQPALARRRRPGHPVELPAAHAGLEDRAGARRGQHRRAQAGRDDAADGAHLRRDRAAGRPSARGRQHHHRRGGDRRDAGAASGCEQGRLHRVDRRRPRDRQGDRRNRQEGHPRARRQGRQHRLRRRPHRPGGRGHRQRHLLQPGPRLLRRQPTARAGERARRGARPAQAPTQRPCASATRSTRTPTSARSTRPSSSSGSRC